MPSLIQLIPLAFKPGIVKNLTDYANKGGWFSCNWVRFRNGLPEKMGGWLKQLSTAFLGVCRSMFNWTLLDGDEYTSLGTNLKFYVMNNTRAFVDVTPIRRTVTLGADPFASTDGSPILRVTDTGHGAIDGDYVTFSGATGFAGILDAQINQEFSITYDDVDHYFITVSSNANATTTGGGAAVEAEYQINIGLASNIVVNGWGTGTWGRSGWGTNDPTGSIVYLRLWSQDNFGEDLFTCVRNGGIYVWDGSNPTDRMVALEDIGGASDAPVVATCVLVSAEEEHAVAFGCNPIGSSTQDPMFVRWSDAEDMLNWTPEATNSAGGYRLSVGTKVLNAVHTRRETVIFTDQAVYSMQWVGPPFTFSFNLVSSTNTAIAPNAMVVTNDFVVWMGRNQFFTYDGRVKSLNCTISDYLYRTISYPQVEKTYGYSNPSFNEVGWLCPGSSGECDFYIVWNWLENIWYYGDLNRTAWLDRGPSVVPLATSDDSYLYMHETGFDDGSTTPVSAIDAFIESSPIELDSDGPGGRFMFLSRLIPDVTFRNSSASMPTVDMTLSMQNYPGSDISQTNNKSVISSQTIPVQRFTAQRFIRLRGRSLVYRCESNTTGVTWRLGVQRVDIRPDGRR